MKGRRIPYTADQLEFVRSVSSWVRAEAHAAFCQRFQRDDVSLQNFNALCKRKGWMTGRTGRFDLGQEPSNKGKVCPPGKGGRHPNARATQFRKGERRGVATRLYKPVGTERLSKEGYLERKVNDDLPLQARWRAVHIVNWEALHGPMPSGHALKCLDGNRLNVEPGNWECVSRAVLARLNGGRHRKRLAYDAAHPELKPVVMALAKLAQKAAERSKDAA